jgi:hypothetical protein
MGLAVKKIAWCLWLVLSISSAALSLERRDGAYYCTVKFSGGVAYNDALKRWEGATFKLGPNFVLKLSFRQTTKAPAGSFLSDSDEYDVTITEEGNSDTTLCMGFDGKPPSMISPYMSCTWLLGLYEFQFDFDNHRFTRIFRAGYIDGGDKYSDTPSISGGLCTKISP